MITAQKVKHLDATAMFTYSHANTSLAQLEHGYYLSYFINGYVGLCMAMYGYVGLSRVVYGYVGLCRAVYSYVWLCMAM